MNKRTILSGAIAAAALYAIDASAQFNYQNGDLLAGFGNGGSTDVIVDLGSLANFQAGTSHSWNLNSVLTSTFGSVSSGMYWSVFGVNDQSIPFNSSVTQGDPNTVWVSLGRSNPNVATTAPFTGSSGVQQLAVPDIETIGNLTNPNQASPGLIVDVSPGVELVATSLGGYTSMMTGSYNGNFQGDWAYNVLNNGAGTSDLYQSDPTHTRATLLGNFTLGPSGDLTFNPVPEPSTWAMFGSGVLALFAIRRRNK